MRCRKPLKEETHLGAYLHAMARDEDPRVALRKVGIVRSCCITTIVTSVV